jgi:hypothetical protein
VSVSSPWNPCPFRSNPNSSAAILLKGDPSTAESLELDHFLAPPLSTILMGLSVAILLRLATNSFLFREETYIVSSNASKP